MNGEWLQEATKTCLGFSFILSPYVADFFNHALWDVHDTGMGFFVVAV